MHYKKMKDPQVEAQLEQTLRAHEMVISLLRSPNLARSVNSLYDAKVRQEASENPINAAQHAGVAMPEGGKAYIHNFADGEWEAEVHLPQGRGLLIVGYSSIRGFYQR